MSESSESKSENCFFSFELVACLAARVAVFFGKPVTVSGAGVGIDGGGGEVATTGDDVATVGLAVSVDFGVPNRSSVPFVVGAAARVAREGAAFLFGRTDIRL